MTDNKELTLGQELVGIRFNPSELTEVDKAKQYYANLIDAIYRTDDVNIDKNIWDINRLFTEFSLKFKNMSHADRLVYRKSLKDFIFLQEELTKTHIGYGTDNIIFSAMQAQMSLVKLLTWSFPKDVGTNQPS